MTDPVAPLRASSNDKGSDDADVARLFTGVTHACIGLVSLGILLALVTPWALGPASSGGQLAVGVGGASSGGQLAVGVGGANSGGVLAVGVGLAAAGVGGLLGFLFGIPGRTEASRRTPTSGAGTTADTALTTPNTTPAESDPLNEIARWMTQIITGAGVVNLRALLRWIGDVGKEVGRAVNVTENAQGVFGVSLVVYFAIIGFATIYIHAKTILVAIFALYSNRVRALGVQVRRQAENIQESADKANALAAEVDLKAQETLLFQLLYQKDGFQRAIDVGEGMLANAQADLSARTRVYLACAYGQRYCERFGGDVEASERDAKTEDALQTHDAKRAYSLLVEAVTADPNVRPLVVGLLSAHADPANPDSDDDLSALAKIPAFSDLATKFATRG